MPLAASALDRPVLSSRRDSSWPLGPVDQPALRGRVLGLQAANVTASTLAIELSNVGVFVVR